MKKLIQAGFILTAMSVLLYSCSNPYEKMQKNVETIEAQANPEVLSLKGNTVSADVTVTFPPKYFEKPMILKITPVLAYEGGEIEGTPKYYQGEDIKDNYTVVSKKDGATFTTAVTLPYTPEASVSTLEMRIEGRYAENKKAELTEFAPFGALPVAQGVSTVQSLTKPNAVIIPDNFKRITTITEEAEIHYNISSSQVRNAELNQEQIKLFQSFVNENKDKEKVTLGNVSSKGYASPDGPEKFNDKLSSERSKTGEKAIKGKLKGVDVAYDAAAYGEDWDGFKKLVEASDMADKDLILQVLAMYDDAAKRDQEIKNLSSVYTELKKSVLPQLRRTQLVVSADVEGKSDAEIIEAVNAGDTSLNVNEMLYGAALVDNKIAAYQLAADTYNDASAWNNLAVELLNSGDVEGAKNAIDKAAALESNDTITNNLAAVAIAQGDYDSAKQYLSALNTEDAKANKGIVAMHEGDYAAAAKDLSSYDLAVAEVLNGNYANAKSALGSDNSADAEYLRAVISMREGDSKGAIAYLKSAVAKNEDFSAKAKKDIEFSRLFDDAEFQAL